MSALLTNRPPLGKPQSVFFSAAGVEGRRCSGANSVEPGPVTQGNRNLHGSVALRTRSCCFPKVISRLCHRETIMFQILPGHRRPSLSTVLIWVAVTVLWWSALCLVSGRLIWLW
jgi:hypothetical protein